MALTPPTVRRLLVIFAFALSCQPRALACPLLEPDTIIPPTLLYLWPPAFLFGMVASAFLFWQWRKTKAQEFASAREGTCLADLRKSALRQAFRAKVSAAAIFFAGNITFWATLVGLASLSILPPSFETTFTQIAWMPEYLLEAFYSCGS